MTTRKTRALPATTPIEAEGDGGIEPTANRGRDNQVAPPVVYGFLARRRGGTVGRSQADVDR